MANSTNPDQLASKKPTNLDLHCLQMQGISGFNRARVNRFYWCLDLRFKHCNSDCSARIDVP